jgi:O-antigen ligase
MAAAALWSWGPGGLPGSLALSAVAMLGAAALLLMAGAGARARPDATSLFASFCWAYVITGLLNAGIGLLQVFAPSLGDGAWLSASSIAGRAVGNLRQPNHLSSMLTWGLVAVVGLLELRRLAVRWAVPMLVVLVAAVVLTASRTGLVSVLLLALWGLADRRLRRSTRALLLATPLVYGAVWWGMAQWAAATAHAFGGAARLVETDISGSRFGIWANTLELIGQQPWAGVGWGEFNYAWTLTPFPGRPIAFFDHAHNLPLQLLVELGLPLGTVVLALLIWGLWRAARHAWAPAADAHGAEPGAARRCAVMMVLMIGLHSLLEYPLWYAYFLLPAAWAWGFALPATARIGPPSRALVAGGSLLVLGTAVAVADYQRVASIFSARAGSAPLEARIRSGQQSLFFAHHADYAAATAGVPVADPGAAFDRATHFLLDTRLMKAWAQALAAQGREDEARHLAQRLREFRKPDTEEFFGACDDQAVPLPFQCLPPQAPVNWRRYLPAD